MKISNIDVRDAFFDKVYTIAQKDRNVVFLTDDMGAYSLDAFKKNLSGQFINVGVAEQNMISLAAGLALGGKKVFAYGIAPFVTMRCYEQIKIDLCCMNLPVTVVSVGAGYTYGSDGPTHHAIHDIAIMRVLPEITILNPSDAVMTAACAEISYKNSGPHYVRIERGKLPQIYNEQNSGYSEGIESLKSGSDLTIVATGAMVHIAFNIVKRLAQYSVNAGIIDFYRIKPVNENLLLKFLDQSKKIATIEENSIVGGIGTIVSEVLSDNNKQIPLKRMAVNDYHCYRYGDREWLNALSGLDEDSIVKRILDWM